MEQAINAYNQMMGEQGRYIQGAADVGLRQQGLGIQQQAEDRLAREQTMKYDPAIVAKTIGIQSIAAGENPLQTKEKMAQARQLLNPEAGHVQQTATGVAPPPGGLSVPPGAATGNPLVDLLESSSFARDQANKLTDKRKPIGKFLWDLNSSQPQGFIRQNFPAIEQYIKSKYGDEVYRQALMPPGAVRPYDWALFNVPNLTRQIGEQWSANSDEMQGLSALRNLQAGR